MPKQLNQQVNLQFTADTGKAKREIQDLQNSLQKLSTNTISLSDFGLTKEIQEAQRAASGLAAAIKSSVGSTGQLDLSKFNSELKKSGMTLTQYRETLRDLGPAGDAAFNQLANSIYSAEVPLKRANTLLQEFGTTLANTARWQISSSILHGFMGSIQSAYGYAQRLNESLNKIRIVTGQSEQQMAKFATTANKAAQALSTSTTQYTDAALIFYQQGLSDQDVEARTNAVIKMSQATGDSATDVSSYMTAIWNNFDDGSESLEHYADVITALGASTASSSSEIAEGLSKFASIAETVGLSYDYATSALATIVATTRQSADTVGTSLKTIFARLQDLELEGSVTDEDGVTTSLGQYSQALEKVGVQVLEANGKMRAMDDILNDLAGKWNNLEKAEQTALAQNVAGTRQYTQLVALMENWDTMMENVTTAQNANGTLSAQAAIYEESWEAARNRVEAALQSIYKSLIDEKFFIGIADTFTKILNYVDNFIDSLGGVKGVLVLISGLLTNMFAGNIATGMNNMIHNLKVDLGIAKEEAKQLKKEAMTAQVNDAQNSVYTAQNAMYKFYAEQASLQEKLLSDNKELSIEEEKQVQILLDQNQATTQSISKLEEKFQKEKKIADVKQRQLNLSSNGNIVNNLETQLEDESAFQILDSAFSGVNLDNAQNTENVLKTVNGVINDLTKSFEQLGIQEQGAFAKGRKAGEAFERIRKAAAAGDISSLKEEFSKLNGSADQATMNIDKLRVSLVDQLSKQGIPDASKKVDEFVESLRNQNLTEAELIEKTNKFNQEITNIGETFKKAKGPVYSFGDGIAAGLQMITAFANAINSIRSLVDTWNNDDLTFGEKFINTITTLSFMLPMLTNAFNANNVAKLAGLAVDKKQHDLLVTSLLAKAAELKAKKKNTAATIAETGAKTADTAVTGAETVANTSLAAAIWSVVAAWIAAHAALVIIIAIAALIVGAWVAIADAQKKADPSYQLEQSKKRAQEYREELEKITQQSQKMFQVYDGYQQVCDRFKKMKLGAEGYLDVLNELNDKADETIDYYKSLGYDIRFEYDARGAKILNQDDIDAAKKSITDTKYNEQAKVAYENVYQNKLEYDIAAGKGAQPLQNYDDSIYDLLNGENGVGQNIYFGDNNAWKGKTYADIWTELAGKSGQWLDANSTGYDIDFYYYPQDDESKFYTALLLATGKLQQTHSALDTATTFERNVAQLTSLAGSNENANSAYGAAYQAWLESYADSNSEVFDSDNSMLQAIDTMFNLGINSQIDRNKIFFGKIFGRENEQLLDALDVQKYLVDNGFQNAIDWNSLGLGTKQILDAYFNSEALDDYADSFTSWVRRTLNIKALLNQDEDDKATDYRSGLKDDDKEKFDEYVKYLKSINVDLAANEKVTRRIVAANMKYNEGIDDLSQNYETYLSNLAQSKHGTKEYSDALKSVKTDIEKMMDLDSPLEVLLGGEGEATNFVTSHLDLIKKAAEGDEDAINNLSLATATAMSDTLEVSESEAVEFNTFLSNLDPNLEIGTSLNADGIDESLITMLNSMIMSSEEAKDKIREIFDAMGWDLVIDENGIVLEESLYRGKRSASSKIKDNNGGKSKKSVKLMQDEIDRYHQVRNELEDIEDELTRISKAQERAFGASKLALMNDEIAAQEKLIQTQKDYVAEINGYLSYDKSQLQKYGVQFDENGTISNYEDVMKAQLAKYNGSLTEQAEIDYNYFKSLISKYEESQELAKDELEKLIEYERELFDKNLAKIEYKVKVHIDVNENELKQLDYYLTKIEDKQYGAAESLSLLTEQANIYMNNAIQYQEGIDDILNQHGITFEEFKAMSAEQLAELNMTENEISTLINYSNELLEVNKNIYETQKTVWEALQKTYEATNEAIDKQVEKLQHGKKVIQDYANIVQLSGIKITPETQDLIDNATYSASLGSVDAAKTKLDTLKADREALMQLYSDEMDEITKRRWQEQKDALDEQIAAAEEDYLSTWAETLEEAQDQFTNAIDAICESAQNAVSGLAGTLSHLKEQLERSKDVEDEYLDDYEKIYQLNKLNNNIQKEMDKSSSVKARAALLDLQEEITRQQAEGTKLSEYELGYLQKKYDLRLAEIALEDAQNAKSQVSLTRDSEGNYGYVYTADANKIGEAEQAVSDAWYELAKYQDEQYEKMESQYIKIADEYYTKLAELEKNRTILGEEEYQKQKEDLVNYYTEKTRYFEEWSEQWLDNNNDTYNKELDRYQLFTKDMSFKDAEYADTFEKTRLGQVAGFEKVSDAGDALKTNMANALEQTEKRFDEYQTKIGQACGAAGTSIDGVKNTLQTLCDEMTGEDGLAKQTADAIAKIASEGTSKFSAAATDVASFQTQYDTTATDIINKSEAMATAIQGMYKALADTSGTQSLKETFDKAREQAGAKAASITTEKTPGSTDDNTLNVKDYVDPNVYDQKTITLARDHNRLAHGQTYFILDEDISRPIGTRRAVPIDVLYKYGKASGKNVGGYPIWLLPWRSEVIGSIASNFDTGGYTGNWHSPEGRIAMLHEKELVLNAQDTENILASVEMMREIAHGIDIRAMGAQSNFALAQAAYLSSSSGNVLDQNVHITAEFPNATDRNEILAAFDNVINLASQYAHRF